MALIYLIQVWYFIHQKSNNKATEFEEDKRKKTCIFVVKDILLKKSRANYQRKDENFSKSLWWKLCLKYGALFDTPRTQADSFGQVSGFAAEIACNKRQLIRLVSTGIVRMNTWNGKKLENFHFAMWIQNCTEQFARQLKIYLSESCWLRLEHTKVAKKNTMRNTYT